MYFSLIITFVLLLVIVVPAIQNSMPLDFKFFTWTFQISITALIVYASLMGGTIKAGVKAGTDISEATKEAVTGAIEAGDEIGTEASKAVREALATSVKGAKDVVKPPSKS